jgi:hypothetical protein
VEGSQYRRRGGAAQECESFSSPGTEGAFLAVADGFTLAKGAPHLAEAVAWLEMVGSKEAQEAFNALKGSIPVRTDVDKGKFGAYQQWSMGSFDHDVLLASCVHGGAVPATFQQELNDAIGLFVADRNMERFTGGACAGRQSVRSGKVGAWESGSEAHRHGLPSIKSRDHRRLSVMAEKVVRRDENLVLPGLRKSVRIIHLTVPRVHSGRTPPTGKRLQVSDAPEEASS